MFQQKPPAARRWAIAAGVLVAACSAWAQYDAPADYFNSVTDNPVTLKNELHLIISSNYWISRPGGVFTPNGNGHYIRSYDDARYGLQVVDGDPDNTGNVILAYNGASVDGTWDSGATWNREHRWPSSIGLGSSGADYSDMHQLIACNPSINSSRGNDPYGTPTSSGTYSGAGSYWYPGDSDQPGRPDIGNDTGDAARAMFYMAVRYDGADSATVDLELKNGLASGDQMGDLAALMVWHYKDPPSTFEKRRNHLIFSQADNPYHYQGNRNPFVDRPEYVWSIFGDGANDSKIHLDASPPADGTSTLAINFGNVPIGYTPAPQNVTLYKTGADPTYYQVATSGAVACDITGRDNAFEANAQTVTLSVSLPAGTTDTPGTKNGTIVIDNLEISHDATGTGSLDGDDTIQISVVVGTLTCNDPFADFDDDDDVDQADFAELQLCYSGGDPYGSGCGCFDRDFSGTVNLVDFFDFQACVSGPNNPANTTCDD